MSTNARNQPSRATVTTMIRSVGVRGNMCRWGRVMAAARSARMDDGSLQAFRRLIRAEALARAGKPIPSSTADQAAAIMETFFARAETSVRILTGGLNARIYGTNEVIVEAKKFLYNRQSSLSIIFLEPQNQRLLSRHPLLSSLNEYDNVHLFETKREFAELVSFHFSVLDRHAYRFKNEIGSHSSVTSFGDVAFAGRLIDVFERLRDLSIPVRLLQLA